MIQTGCSHDQAVNRLTDDRIFRIHEDFRIVATMNPVEYAGRNILSPAFMNRFKVKWIDEPYSLERQAIFNEIFKDEDGSPMLSKGFLARMDWFHERMKEAALARVIGREERDPYYYSIRDLLKAGHRMRKRIDQEEKGKGRKIARDEREMMAVSVLADVYSSRIRDEGDAEAVTFSLETVLWIFSPRERGQSR